MCMLNKMTNEAFVVVFFIKKNLSTNVKIFDICIRRDFLCSFVLLTYEYLLLITIFLFNNIEYSRVFFFKKY